MAETSEPWIEDAYANRDPLDAFMPLVEFEELYGETAHAPAPAVPAPAPPPGKGAHVAVLFDGKSYRGVPPLFVPVGSTPEQAAGADPRFRGLKYAAAVDPETGQPAVNILSDAAQRSAAASCCGAPHHAVVEATAQNNVAIANMRDAADSASARFRCGEEADPPDLEDASAAAAAAPALVAAGTRAEVCCCSCRGDDDGPPLEDAPVGDSASSVAAPAAADDDDGPPLEDVPAQLGESASSVAAGDDDRPELEDAVGEIASASAAAPADDLPPSEDVPPEMDSPVAALAPSGTRAEACCCCGAEMHEREKRKKKREERRRERREGGVGAADDDDDSSSAGELEDADDSGSCAADHEPCRPCQRFLERLRAFSEAERRRLAKPCLLVAPPRAWRGGEEIDIGRHLGYLPAKSEGLLEPAALLAAAGPRRTLVLNVRGGKLYAKVQGKTLIISKRPDFAERARCSLLRLSEHPKLLILAAMDPVDI